MLLEKWYTITGKCIDSGRYGYWGKKGQVQTMGNVLAFTDYEAFEKGKGIFPGGWQIIKVEVQDHRHDGVCNYFKKQTIEDEDKC